MQKGENAKWVLIRRRSINHKRKIFATPYLLKIKNISKAKQSKKKNENSEKQVNVLDTFHTHVGVIFIHCCYGEIERVRRILYPKYYQRVNYIGVSQLYKPCGPLVTKNIYIFSIILINILFLPDTSTIYVFINVSHCAIQYVQLVFYFDVYVE